VKLWRGEFKKQKSLKWGKKISEGYRAEDHTVLTHNWFFEGRTKKQKNKRGGRDGWTTLSVRGKKKTCNGRGKHVGPKRAL